MSSLSEYQTLINNLFDLIGKIKNTRKIITDTRLSTKITLIRLTYLKQTNKKHIYLLFIFFQISIMIQK